MLLIVCSLIVIKDLTIGDMDVRKRFGVNVRQIRQDHGYSQEELADRSGLHRTYVGSVERGERNISLDNIVALAQALHVPVADLFSGIGIETVGAAGFKR